MKRKQFFYLAIAASMIPGVALADDPKDPAMRNAELRAQDREITRGLNRREGAAVRKRDARYAQGNRASRAEYAARSHEHERAVASYERELASWRRAVAACRAGDYSACDN